MKTLALLSLGVLLTAPSVTLAAPPMKQPVVRDHRASARPSPRKAAELKSGKADQLSTATIIKRIVKGEPGDWKFVGAGSGALSSGKPVRIGSAYSGECLGHETQPRGINLGHVHDCNKTEDGVNITFAKSAGDKSGKPIVFGEAVTIFIGASGPDGYICYGKREHGINLGWGETDSDCTKKPGSKGKGLRQWKLMPVAGSSLEVGDQVPLDGLIRIVSLVNGEDMVKCARLNTPFTYRNGHLQWRTDCLGFEVVFSYKDYLKRHGQDPRKLAFALVPSKYRSILEKVL